MRQKSMRKQPSSVPSRLPSFRTLLSTWKEKATDRVSRRSPYGDLVKVEQDEPTTPSAQDTIIEEIEDAQSKVSFSGSPFKSLYSLGEELGSGAFAVVKSGKHRKTGRDYAIKICSGREMTEQDLRSLEFEISIGMELDHPNIVRLYEAFLENNNYYLVTEKMMGGELLDRIVQKTYYNEKEARDVCKILFQAMEYCHLKGIAHRDLKPENLLLVDGNNDSSLKIADLGFAKKCPEEGFRTMCGSPGYVAPEILLQNGPYDWSCDMWSLGVIVYILLGGYSPFDEECHKVMVAQITTADYVFDKEYWDPISNDAKDLIRSLLTLDPKKRLTATEALKHKWVTASDEVLANQDLGANLTELQKFQATRKFKAAVKIIMATNRLGLLSTSTKQRRRNSIC